MSGYAGYVDPRYLHTVAEIIRPIKERSYELLQLQKGDSVLDVGCGAATDTLALGAIVGPLGTVVGVDSDRGMVTLANRKAHEAKMGVWIYHQEASGERLPFRTSSFSACHGERVFQHSAQPDQLLSEMVRVTRPGGRVVAVDTDHSAQSMDTSETDIEWRLRRFRADMMRNGYAGRQLYGWFQGQPLVDVTVEIRPLFTTDYALERYMSVTDAVEREALSAGVVTQAELDRLDTDFRRADAEGKYFGYGCMFIVAGRKPEQP
ncbi:MAG TPA: methyltransferase domain-containing protein [Aggregatilineales bacterium]|nr:methyltransferase domain-containing protein [Aggregatilineales bacterium]